MRAYEHALYNLIALLVAWNVRLTGSAESPSAWTPLGDASGHHFIRSIRPLLEHRDHSKTVHLAAWGTGDTAAAADTRIGQQDSAKGHGGSEAGSIIGHRHDPACSQCNTWPDQGRSRGLGQLRGGASAGGVAGGIVFPARRVQQQQRVKKRKKIPDVKPEVDRDKPRFHFDRCGLKQTCETVFKHLKKATDEGRQIRGL